MIACGDDEFGKVAQSGFSKLVFSGSDEGGDVEGADVGPDTAIVVLARAIELFISRSPVGIAGLHIWE